MGSINLYKIEEKKQELFLDYLTSRMQYIKTIDSSDFQSDQEEFQCMLYFGQSENEKRLAWNWILREFDQPDLFTTSAPRAVVLIKKKDLVLYALTFGRSFFLVDKFCDKDFGFDFARKIEFEEIKTTALTAPNSKRNKMVNTYINYSELEFDSGESFAKLKAKTKLPEEFKLYKPALEIGKSIKFAVSDNSLKTILEIILHVEKVIEEEEEKHKIPVFSKIVDEEHIKYLNNRLVGEMKENPQINISELDIIGTTEIFNHNDDEFLLRYHDKEKYVTSLSSTELELFCDENQLDYSEIVLKIAVVSLYDGVPVNTQTVLELIDYTDDEERCLLSQGCWYKYNDDYLNYLEASLAEIDVEYKPEYDFSDTEHRAYIDRMFLGEKDKEENKGKTEKKIRDALSRKYYAERVFNILREEKDGFENFDRNLQPAGTANIELMDLYKDRCMYAVKIGNASSTLCYAVDQSLSALKMYKHKKMPDMPQIDAVCIWFVLTRKSHIEDENGKPNLNALDMLMLKNRLDEWKKEVRLQGLKPVVYINYRID